MCSKALRALNHLLIIITLLYIDSTLFMESLVFTSWTHIINANGRTQSSLYNVRQNANNFRSTKLHMAYNTFVRVSSDFEVDCKMDADNGVSLTDYMRLPVDQYVCIDMPLNATLQRMGSSDSTVFNLTVPPVTFFQLSVSPMLFCHVTQSEESVRIQSSSCILRGSPYVESLNGCFEININTVFSWVDTEEKRSLCSKSDIFVQVDPPRPFKYFGKTILEATGSLAMSIALNQIENAFVKSLVKDYERWVTDAEYRVSRENGCEVLSSSCTIEDIVSTAESTLSLSSSSTSTTILTTSDVSLTSMASNIMSSSNDTITDHLIVEASSPSVLNISPMESIVVVDSPDTTGGEGIAMKGPIVEAGVVESRREMKAAAAATTTTTSTKPSRSYGSYISSTKSPNYLTDDMCLVPGADPEIRIELAPKNARRIFTGVDILASIDSVWTVLTNYEELQLVVPSLVKNEVLYRTAEGGARLKQVGGAKVFPGKPRRGDD